MARVTVKMVVAKMAVGTTTRAKMVGKEKARATTRVKTRANMTSPGNHNNNNNNLLHNIPPPPTPSLMTPGINPNNNNAMTTALLTMTTAKRSNLNVMATNQATIQNVSIQVAILGQAIRVRLVP
jgi:hypothetical protein